jgi:hypothetical protein
LFPAAHSSVVEYRLRTMIKQPSRPIETPSQRLANLFKQMARENERRGSEEQLPKRPLRERLKDRSAHRRRAF